MLYLFLATFFWGSTFIVQRTASLHIDAFLFNGIRFGIAGIVFFIILKIFKIKDHRKSINNGCFSGFLIMLAINLQQLGVERTSASKAGIITSLYILFVPFFLILRGRMVTKLEILFLILSLFGFTLLSGDIEYNLKLGDLLVLISAIVFAYQVVYVGEYVSNHNVIAFSTYQYLACGFSSLLFTPFVSKNFFSAIGATWFEIFYACFFSVIIGYTFQILGQKRVSTNTASFIMSLEGPIAMILGYLILNEFHTGCQYFGALLILLSASLATCIKKKS